MPGYIYRDELLTLLTPLLERLSCKPDALVTLRISPRGIELDYRNLPPDPFAPLEFAFFNIADHDPTPAPVVDSRTDEALAEKAEAAQEREAHR